MARPPTITPETKATVLKRWAEHPSIRGLAREFSLAPATISKIVHDKPRVHTPLADPEELPESVLRDRVWGQAGATFSNLQMLNRLLRTELLKGEGADPSWVDRWSSSLVRLYTSFGIAVDKARLLHNETTAIVATSQRLRELPEGVDMDEFVAAVKVRAQDRLKGFQPVLVSGGSAA